MAIRIICIKKANGNHENPYVAILSLGWVSPSDKKRGITSREGMYNWLLNGGYAYVEDLNGNRAKLITAVSSKGTKYVKTEANDSKSDNLLNLFECQ